VSGVTFVVLVTVMFAAPMCVAQALQKGISVELAPTGNAAPMPDADNENSLIVTVTGNGSEYFGIDPITPAALAEKITGRLSNQEQKLYIKADARTPYADVSKVLDAARTAGVEAPILLTSQPESPEPGTVVPPKGLEVLVSPPPSGSVATVVQVLSSGLAGSTLKINNEQVPWSTLQSTLSKLLQDRSEKVVLVQADGPLPFAQVVHVIDTCRSTGADVVLVTPLWTIERHQ
jgi:biopolymer transport protein ExbD/biopolymer transport protein TolR